MNIIIYLFVKKSNQIVYRTRTVRGAEYLSMECHGRNQSVETKRSTTSSIFILVVGASGDVAKKKIYPALFELYKRYFVSSSSLSSQKSGCTVRIHGFARTKQSTDQFRNQIRYGLKYYRNHGSFFHTIIIHNLIYAIVCSGSLYRMIPTATIRASQLITF